MTSRPTRCRSTPRRANTSTTWPRSTARPTSSSTATTCARGGRRRSRPGCASSAPAPDAWERGPLGPLFFFSNLWTAKTGSFAGSLSFDPEYAGGRTSGPRYNRRSAVARIVSAAPAARTNSVASTVGGLVRMIRVSRAAFALFLASAVPAFAQAPAPYPSPSPNPLASARPDDRPVLELSLDDAVRRTLENNADIAVDKFDPESADYNVRGLKGYYEPYLISTFGDRSQTLPATSTFTGAERLNNKTFTYNVGAFAAIPTGGSFEVDFNNNRQATNSIFSTFNPSFTSNFNLNLTQPLLRNLKVDSTRYQIKVAKKSAEISDVQFHQTVVNTVTAVKQSYYDLIYALDNLDAQRKSLGLAQQLLEENRIKVRVGTM